MTTKRRGLGVMHVRDASDTTPVTPWLGLHFSGHHSEFPQPAYPGLYERLGLCEFLSFWDGHLWHDCARSSGAPLDTISSAQTCPWRGRDLDTMYKHLINSHYAGCRLLAEAYDDHRKRDVKVYMLPGERDVVGVSDGTDSWIAPVVINPFSVDVRKLLGEIAAGGSPAVAKAGQRDVEKPRVRRQFTAEAPAQEAEPAPAPDTGLRRRMPSAASTTAPEVKRVRRSLHV